jgi:hypothetical protein
MAKATPFTRVKLKKMFSAIARDIRTAHFHFRLHCELKNSTKAFPREMNQTPVFWNLTMDAHLYAAQIALARAYDKAPTGLNLKMLLQRLYDSKSKPWRPKAGGHKRPTKREFEKDKLSVTWWPHVPAKGLRARRNKLVQKLVWNRNKLFAHFEWDVAISGRIPKRCRLTYGDYEKLLDRASALLDKYGNVFLGTSYSVELAGADDYTKVLKAQKAAVRAVRKKLADEYRAFRTP